MGIKVVAAEQVPTNGAEQYDRFQGFAEAVEVVGGVHSARQMTVPVIASRHASPTVRRSM